MLPVTRGVDMPSSQRRLIEYDPKIDTVLSQSDLHEIRSTMAWSSAWGAYWLERIEINNSSNVTAFVRGTEDRFLYIELSKDGGRWCISSVAKGLGEREHAGFIGTLFHYLERILLGRN
jgi:hypothetical protein